MSLDTSTTTVTNTTMDAFASDVLPKINPAVLDWIRAQRALGDTDQSLFEKLCAAGWEPVLARQVVGMPAPEVAAIPPAPPAPQPGPDLSNQTNSIDLGDCRVQVLMSLELPRTVLFGNLLSDYECDAMIAAAKANGMQRSKTIGHDFDGEKVDPIRTSEGTFFPRGQTEFIQRLETRISRLLNWPVSHAEGFQVLHYLGGNQYEPHHDYFQPSSVATPRYLAHGGQRVGTLILYLSDTEAGGGTIFPETKLSIQPRKGNALFFGYDRPDPATRTLHGGAPVVAGEKWIATKWLRERENI